jgi:hypothetical protein
MNTILYYDLSLTITSLERLIDSIVPVCFKAFDEMLEMNGADKFF